MGKKYYINVELRDYDDNIIGYSSCNLDEDIRTNSIMDAAYVAADLMVKHHTGVKLEQKEQMGDHDGRKV